VDNHYVLMDFHKTFDLKEPEEVSIYAEGQYNVKLDGKPFEGTPAKITVPAGKHKINIKVFCQQAVPSVYVKGKTIVSDGSWLTTFEDKEWIDETGKTSDISATKWLNAGIGILMTRYSHHPSSNCLLLQSTVKKLAIIQF
jgi:hypothetical protein